VYFKLSHPRKTYLNFHRGTRAVGVEYVDDNVGRAKGAVEPKVVNASRLVILSAGAFGTPSILERSGVGSAEVLEKNGVKQFIDLPGVGNNYMGMIFNSH